MTEDERKTLIDQLDRTYHSVETWVQEVCMFSLGELGINPVTGREFASFREAIEVADDATLESLRDDFDENGDLVPAVLH